MSWFDVGRGRRDARDKPSPAASFPVSDRGRPAAYDGVRTSGAALNRDEAIPAPGAGCGLATNGPLGVTPALANDATLGARRQRALPPPMMVVAMAANEKAKRRAVVIGIGVVVGGRIAVIHPQTPAMQISVVPPTAAAPIHLVNV